MPVFGYSIFEHICAPSFAALRSRIRNGQGTWEHGVIGTGRSETEPTTSARRGGPGSGALWRAAGPAPVGWCSATIAPGSRPATYGICAGCYKRLATNATRPAWFDGDRASSPTDTLPRRGWTADELLWEPQSMESRGRASCGITAHTDQAKAPPAGRRTVASCCTTVTTRTRTPTSGSCRWWGLWRRRWS